MKIVYIILTVVIMFSDVRAEDYSELINTKDLQADFTQLYTDLKKSHIDLFANVSEQQYDTKFTDIMGQLDKPLTRLKAHTLFQEFVAFGLIAHSNIGFPATAYESFRNDGGKAFPIYVTINGDQWFVEDDYSVLNLSKGTPITHIDDVPVQQLLTELHKYISADTPAIASSLLEYQLPQYLWLVNAVAGKASESAKLTIIHDAKEQHLEVNFIDQVTLQERIAGDIAESESTSSKLREYRALSEKIGYLKPGPFYNAENPADLWNNSEFSQFIDEAMESFITNGKEAIIIDVRNNPGGTNTFSDHLIAWFANKPFKFASQFLIRSSEHAQASNAVRLSSSTEDMNSVSHQLAKFYEEHPFDTVANFNLADSLPRDGEKFEGEIYVLIDRSSYSNAVSLAAIVQDYNLGKVVGEATADFATTYASMESFTLTNTGIQVGFPKAHIIRPSGDKKAGPVYPDIILNDVTIDSVVTAIANK